VTNHTKSKLLLFSSVILYLLPLEVFAADSLFDNTGDIIWVLTAGILVFFMQAGFALIESGMSRAKNAINVIMKNYTDMCFGAIAYWLIGFGLMFGMNSSGFIGTDHFAVDGSDMSVLTMLFFQTMFAATAATIVSGALAERIHFRSYVFASILITAIIYPIFGSWAWGGMFGGSGWLSELGFIDFAGSSVVHSVGGWCALAGIIVLGPRLGKYASDGGIRVIPGHNLTLVAVGGFILWMGWFGFNGGSLLKASADIGGIIINTHLAAASGVVGAILYMLITGRKILMTYVVNSSLGGLVAITAGCNNMEPVFALLTGVIAGILVVVSIEVFEKMRIDDVVGAVSVHGVCGAWGTLAVGFFNKGDLFNTEQIFVQVIGVMACFIWSFFGALIIFKVLDVVIGLRTTTKSEQRGLDYAEHNEIGYPEFQQQQLHDGQRG